MTVVGSRASHVTIVGAGIVGACCALALRREGLEVTLIERGEPGAACSSGNAGIISTGGCVPLAIPGIVRRLPALLFGRDSPLVIRPAYLAAITPWLLRLYCSSGAKRVEAISKALTDLLVRSPQAYRQLLDPEDHAALIRSRGLLHVFRTEEAFAASLRAREIRERRGIKSRVLEAGELRQLEPALAPDHKRGLLFPDSQHILDPLELTRRIVHRFIGLGGELLAAEVLGIERDARDRLRITTSAGARPVDHIVIAAGAWSRALAAQAGLRVPLDAERGYHAMIPAAEVPAGVMPHTPFISADHNVAVTPMAQGLRITGTVEFAGLKAPPDYGRAERLVAAAQRLLPGLRAPGASYWMGMRPSVPDSLPVIGPCPRDRRILCAFGHGHGGVGYGPITARMIADAILRRPPEFDVSPFAPGRFQSSFLPALP